MRAFIVSLRWVGGWVGGWVVERFVRPSPPGVAGWGLALIGFDYRVKGAVNFQSVADPWKPAR